MPVAISIPSGRSSPISPPATPSGGLSIQVFGSFSARVYSLEALGGGDLHKVHQSNEHDSCRDHSHLRKAFIQRDCCCSWCYRCSVIGSGAVHISMSKGFDGFEWESRQSSSQCNRVLAGHGQPDCDGWDQRCATENLSPSQTHQSSSAQ